MPYVTCRHCRLTVYTAARFTSIDRCPNCGTELDPRRRDAALLEATQRVLARSRRPSNSPRSGPRAAPR
jgi:hypothetical protein